jgi:CRP-like cAMP-binding protein
VTIVGEPVWSPELIHLEQFGTARTYRRQTTLFEQNSPSEVVYLLKEGYVKLCRAEECGSGIGVGLRHRGSLLGHAAAILDEQHSATAQTLTDCQVREIPAKLFRHSVRLNPDLSWRLHLLQSREIQNRTVRIASIGGLSARRRLERFLAEALMLQEPAASGPPRLTPPLRHVDLAAMVAVTPEHLSRLLRRLENDGVILRDRGWLIALHLDALENAASEGGLRDRG